MCAVWLIAEHQRTRTLFDASHIITGEKRRVITAFHEKVKAEARLTFQGEWLCQVLCQVLLPRTSEVRSSSSFKSLAKTSLCLRGLINNQEKTLMAPSILKVFGSASFLNTSLLDVPLNTPGLACSTIAWSILCSPLNASWHGHSTMVWPICHGLVNPTWPSHGLLALLLEEAAMEARGLNQKCLHLRNLAKDYFIKILPLSTLTPSLPSKFLVKARALRGLLQTNLTRWPSLLSLRTYLRAAPLNVCHEVQGHAQSIVPKATCVYFANSESYAAAEGIKEIQKLEAAAKKIWARTKPGQVFSRWVTWCSLSGLFEAGRCSMCFMVSEACVTRCQHSPSWPAVIMRMGAALLKSAGPQPTPAWSAPSSAELQSFGIWELRAKELELWKTEHLQLFWQHVLLLKPLSHHPWVPQNQQPHRSAVLLAWHSQILRFLSRGECLCRGQAQTDSGCPALAPSWPMHEYKFIQHCPPWKGTSSCRSTSLPGARLSTVLGCFTHTVGLHSRADSYHASLQHGQKTSGVFMS